MALHFDHVDKGLCLKHTGTFLARHSCSLARKLHASGFSDVLQPGLHRIWFKLSRKAAFGQIT